MSIDPDFYKCNYSRRYFNRDLGFLIPLCATGQKVQVFVRTTKLLNEAGESPDVFSFGQVVENISRNLIFGFL